MRFNNPHTQKLPDKPESLTTHSSGDGVSFAEERPDSTVATEDQPRRPSSVDSFVMVGDKGAVSLHEDSREKISSNVRTCRERSKSCANLDTVPKQPSLFGAEHGKNFHEEVPRLSMDEYRNAFVPKHEIPRDSPKEDPEKFFSKFQSAFKKGMFVFGKQLPVNRPVSPTKKGSWKHVEATDGAYKIGKKTVDAANGRPSALRKEHRRSRSHTTISPHSEQLYKNFEGAVKNGQFSTSKALPAIKTNEKTEELSEKDLKRIDYAIKGGHFSPSKQLPAIIKVKQPTENTIRDGEFSSNKQHPATPIQSMEQVLSHNNEKFLAAVRKNQISLQKLPMAQPSPQPYQQASNKTQVKLEFANQKNRGHFRSQSTFPATPARQVSKTIFKTLDEADAFTPRKQLRRSPSPKPLPKIKQEDTFAATFTNLEPVPRFPSMASLNYDCDSDSDSEPGGISIRGLDLDGAADEEPRKVRKSHSKAESTATFSLNNQQDGIYIRPRRLTFGTAPHQETVDNIRARPVVATASRLEEVQQARPRRLTFGTAPYQPNAQLARPAGLTVASISRQDNPRQTRPRGLTVASVPRQENVHGGRPHRMTLALEQRARPIREPRNPLYTSEEMIKDPVKRGQNFLSRKNL